MRPSPLLLIKASGDVDTHPQRFTVAPVHRMSVQHRPPFFLEISHCLSIFRVRALPVFREALLQCVKAFSSLPICFYVMRTLMDLHLPLKP